MASDVSISCGDLLVIARPASPIDKMMKKKARTDVARVRKFAAPRADIKPAGLPPPASPPPSERCIRITPTSEAAMIK